MRVPKKVFISRNEDDDFEKNANSDFPCLVVMEFDKSYVEVGFPTYILYIFITHTRQINENFQIKISQVGKYSKGNSHSISYTRQYQ